MYAPMAKNRIANAARNILLGHEHRPKSVSFPDVSLSYSAFLGISVCIGSFCGVRNERY